jgi:hypothetical protein
MKNAAFRSFSRFERIYFEADIKKNPEIEIYKSKNSSKILSFTFEVERERQVGGNAGGIGMRMRLHLGWQSQWGWMGMWVLCLR